MKTSVRDLKTHLSACLQRVQLGEECIITLHKAPIAKITPIYIGNDTERLNKNQFIEELKNHLSSTPKGKKSLSELVIQARKAERY